MKKEHWARRVRKALWLASGAVSMAVGYQAQVAADCVDPYCNYTYTYSCSSGCVGTGSLPFACCCSNGTSGCCQYTCQTVYCSPGDPSCNSSGNSFWGGQRKNPYTCDGVQGTCMYVGL